MNFDNGQGLKFGVSNYGQGLANAAGVCHFQYMGVGDGPGGMKPGQGVPQMPVDRNTFVPPYHNVGLAHHQPNQAQQTGFPVGVNMTMSSPMSFSALPPMETFGGHNQGFAAAQRQGMNYKNFNNWVGHNQNNHTSLPSIGHLWSHFQQQQMQKHSVQQQQQQQPQPPQQPHQQNYYQNQQHMQGFQAALALSPNMAGGQRGQNIGYQFQGQNPNIVNHTRMYQTFPPERMQNCIYGSQNAAVVSQNVPVGSDQQHGLKVPNQLHPAHRVNVAGPQVTAICNQVTKPTTTITMTNCNSSSLTTAMVHVNVTVPSVVTSVAVSKPAGTPDTSPQHGAESRPVSATSCGSLHSKPKVSEAEDSEGLDGDQEAMDVKEAEPGLQIVKVPFGWRRTTEQGAVVYYSPSSTRLTSFHEVCKYLSAEGTCKCGLECPLMVEKVFNFDPLVNGKLWTVEDMSTEDLTKLCIHKRKIIAMATFQSSRSIPVTENSRKKGISKKGKKKGKVNSSTATYDGLLVSQLLSQKGKVLPPANHSVNKHVMPVCSAEGAVPKTSFESETGAQSGTDSSAPSSVPKMFENKSGPCKNQALQQLQQLNKVNNILGNTMPDPADDLGPITCQVPAKLDFSKEGFLEDHKNRLHTSMAGHPVGQPLFHQGAVSPQAPFGQDQMKHQVLMQQSVSPCAPAASPSLVNSVPNHMYGPNIPQHFQCQLPMNMQQNTGNIMFQALMQVQNSPAQRFANPPVFEQANMQGSHLQVGSPQNIMMNQGYPQLSDLTWLDPGKPKVKRPRSKKDKQKLNSILDRTSPCPNVDVRHIPQEASKNPSSISTSVSFMENPAAFLAQQTALVHSSLSSTKTDMSQPNPRTPQSLASNTQCVSVTAAPTKGGSVTTSSKVSGQSEEPGKKVLSSTTASISPTHPPSVATSITSAGKEADPSGSTKGDENANCDSSDTPATENISNDCEKDLSDSEQCCDDKQSSSPASNDNTTLPSNAKVNFSENSKTVKTESCESNTKTNKSQETSQQNQTQSNTTSTVVSQACNAEPTITTLANSVIPNNLSEMIAANSLNAVHQALGQQGTGEFPASTLLSAAARAQVSQQNPLGVLMGQPMQVSPSLQVSAGQETGTGTPLPEMLGKAGVNPLEQLNLSLQQQGGGTLMLPPNPNILAGALPGGYINTLNGPTVQGLPLNMYLPVNQPLGNTTGLNPAQNLLIGLDPKSGSPHTAKQAQSNRMSVTEPNKAIDGFNGTAVNFPTLFANIAGGPSTIGANMKLSSTSSSNATQVSAGMNASILNSQFPYVTMNTPMPPMSLPLVTNVTNSLSQVIPAVGVPQAVLNQQQVAPLLSTVTVPTLNNSVVITNQIPSVHTSQFMGVQPAQGGEAESTHTAVATEEISNSANGTLASTDSLSDGTCVSEGNAASVCPKLEATAQGMDAVMNKLVTQPTEVLEQMNSNAGQVVLLPNPNVPLLQLYGANPLLAAPGIDKFGMQQVMLPGTMIDPQLCQNTAAVQGGLNLLQMQQMWNGTGNGNLTNLNAIQLQQLQALQLQLLLQQIQGMVNQIQLQGATQQTLPSEEEVNQSELQAEHEVEEEEIKSEIKEEVIDEESPMENPDGKSDLNANKEDCLAQSPIAKIAPTPRSSDVTDDREVSPESDIADMATNEVSTSSTVNDVSSSENPAMDREVEDETPKIGVVKPELHCTDSDSVSSSTISYTDSASVQKLTNFETNCVDATLSELSIPSRKQSSGGEVKSEKHLKAFAGGRSTGGANCASSDSLLSHLNHNGPEDDLCDDTDSMDDDISLDDLRRGLKRARTDDETDMDSTSIENFDEESIDGLVSEAYLQNFSTGDVVWGQIRGFPLWPGKLVPESAAEGIDLNPSLEERADAVLVMWYGDHTFTRVEPQRLKTWLEGLEAHHKTRRKYRRGRKMNSHLEAAIQEAVKDVKDDAVINPELFSTVRAPVKGRSAKKRKA